jgi:hypothetical protein
MPARNGKPLAALCAAALTLLAGLPLVERWLADPHSDDTFLVERISALGLTLESLRAGQPGALLLLLPPAGTLAAALLPSARWRRGLAAGALAAAVAELGVSLGARAAGNALGLGRGFNMPAGLLLHAALAALLAAAALFVQLRAVRA